MAEVLVHAPNSATGLFDLAAVAKDQGLDVVRIDSSQPDAAATLARAARPGAAYRSAGGLLARAIELGADIALAGADARWFVDLPAELTGRQWSLTDVAGARGMLAAGPTFVKLAATKFGALPAQRYRTADELDNSLAAVHAPPTLQLLATHGWLPIHSEYRAFIAGHDVVTYSPYRVEDEPWSPLLRTHRASFHDEAAAFTVGVLAALDPTRVPPTAVLDIARLDDGRFVVLEVNHVWSSGLYGCDPRGALRTVIVAADVGTGTANRWLWRSDPAATALHR